MLAAAATTTTHQSSTDFLLESDVELTPSSSQLQCKIKTMAYHICTEYNGGGGWCPGVRPPQSVRAGSHTLGYMNKKVPFSNPALSTGFKIS